MEEAETKYLRILRSKMEMRAVKEIDCEPPALAVETSDLMFGSGSRILRHPRECSFEEL